MGILSNIGKWVFENIPTVTNVVKSAAELAHKSASVVDTLLEGQAILAEDEKQLTLPALEKISHEHPGIMVKPGQPPSPDISELQQSIGKNKERLIAIEKENELERRRIQFQIDVMELLVSSFTFERFSNNINLHAASLQLHLQTIQNTEGLLGDVNRQRVAVKALMGTVNHLVNVLGLGNKVNKIEGLDIDIRLGSISILGAYEAFENALNLLLHDIDSFSKAIQKQLARIENVRSAARHIPNISQKVGPWLEISAGPKLVDAEKHANELKSELLAISHLDAGLRRELKTIKQDDL